MGLCDETVRYPPRRSWQRVAGRGSVRADRALHSRPGHDPHRFLFCARVVVGACGDAPHASLPTPAVNDGPVDAGAVTDGPAAGDAVTDAPVDAGAVTDGPTDAGTVAAASARALLYCIERPIAAARYRVTESPHVLQLPPRRRLPHASDVRMYAASVCARRHRSRMRQIRHACLLK